MAASDLSPEGAWAEAVAQLIAARRKEKEQTAKRFMKAILAEGKEGGKSVRSSSTSAWSTGTARRGAAAMTRTACLSLNYLLAFLHA
jgi:hypothetical protein